MLPPNEDQSMWSQLQNVMPISRGSIQRRWGTSYWNSDGLTTSPYHCPKILVPYSNDVLNTRKIIHTTINNVNSGLGFIAYNEDGTAHDLGHSLTQPNTSAVARTVSSRDYAFFVTGATGDRVKWNGNGSRNLLASSQDFEQGLNWNLQGVGGATAPTITADAGVAPDGTTTADLINLGATSGGQNSSITQTIGTGLAVAGLTFTYSVYLKASSGTPTVNIVVKDGTQANSSPAQPCTLSTSWQRFTLTYTYPGGANPGAWVYAVANLGTASAVSIYMWGAQFEQAASASTYQGTVAEPTGTAGTSAIWTWGIDAPATAISVGAPTGGGAITLNTGRNYFVIFENKVTGHFSGLSPVSASTGPLTNQNVPLSNIPVSTDAQVTHKILLATADGGDQTTLYGWYELPNSQTTATDNTSEAILLTGNIFLQPDPLTGGSIGVADNWRPPAGTHIAKYGGRIWIANGQNVYFSKSQTELTTSNGTICGRYEECWPAFNFLDISSVAESVTGLFSSGDALYIGTARHIRRITGTDPTSFSNPDIVFNEVGVLSQEVWKGVFIEGQPVGAMWMTPDFRVIGSDFNTYKDIGTPIQSTLNSINQAAATSSWAAFYANNAYDIFVLAIPTNANTAPDTLCVFDMRSGKWMVWTASGATFSAGCYNVTLAGVPQWLIAKGAITTSGANYIYQFLSTQTQDFVGVSAQAIPVTIRTPWLTLGQPYARKYVDEFDVTGDGTSTITVEVAQTQTDFSSPTTLANNSALTTSPWGTYALYLAGKWPQKWRYLRWTLNNSSTSATDILDAWAADIFPVHQI